MSRARTLRAPAGRVWISATVAPHTKARLDALAARLGVSRGRVLDLALDALTDCDACEGIGRALHSAEPCRACSGTGVVPFMRDT